METQIEKQKLLEKAEKAKENAEIARLQASWQEKQLNADVSYFAPTIENLRPLNRQKETSIVTGISRKDSEIVPSSLYNDVTYNVQASGETPSLITLKSEILYDEIPKLHSNFVETTEISPCKQQINQTPFKLESHQEIPSHELRTVIKSDSPLNAQTQEFIPTKVNVQNTEYIPQNEPIDKFIDKLTEGQETIIANSEDVTTSKILRWEYESRNLPAIELTEFDGASEKWPEFIENFKKKSTQQSII